MNVTKTKIDGLLILEPKVFNDARGYFVESFSQREFDEQVAPLLGHTVRFVQDIDWQIPADHAVLSDKDTRHPLLQDFDSPF